jgi:hypothetical protein
VPQTLKALDECGGGGLTTTCAANSDAGGTDNTDESGAPFVCFANVQRELVEDDASTLLIEHTGSGANGIKVGSHCRISTGTSNSSSIGSASDSVTLPEVVLLPASADCSMRCPPTSAFFAEGGSRSYHDHSTVGGAECPGAFGAGDSWLRNISIMYVAVILKSRWCVVVVDAKSHAC